MGITSSTRRSSSCTATNSIFRDRKVRVLCLLSLDLPISLSRTAFQCLHVWKEPQEKTNLFDPTPPPQRGPGHIKHKVGDCPDVFGRSDYPQNMGQYIVTSKCLGSGAFATVHLAIDPSNHRQVACKTICARRKKDKRQVLLEVEMLKRVRHVSLLALDHRLFP